MRQPRRRLQCRQWDRRRPKFVTGGRVVQNHQHDLSSQCHWAVTNAARHRFSIAWPALVGAAAMWFALGGCTPAAGSPDTTPGAEPLGACATTIRFAGVQDVSFSTGENITPLAVAAQFDPLIDVAVRCGGDLGFGHIDATSNAPLLRLHVAAPAARPIVPSFVGPGPEVARRRRAYLVALLAYRRADSVREVAALVDGDRFRSALDSLLRRPVDARRTDTWGAISRCAQMMGEPVDSGVAVRKWCLAISDMRATIPGPRVDSLPTGVELLVVNGTPAGTGYERFNPRPLESIDAAVRHVVNAMEARHAAR